MTATLNFRVPRAWLAWLVLSASLAGCGSIHRDTFRPYVPEVVQGNFVSKEQVSAIRPGMGRTQVRDILGTPLLTSIFHADRWDYAFTIRRQGSEPQQRRFSVFFKGDALDRIEGDPLPTEAEFAAKLDMSSPANLALLAYLDGINQYQDTHRAPIEFDILGIPQQPFTPQDTVAVTGYLAYSFAAAFRTEPVLTFIRDKLGADYLAYSLLDAIVDRYFTILENIGERTEELEDVMLEHPRPGALQLVFIDPPFDSALFEPALKAAAVAIAPQGSHVGGPWPASATLGCPPAPASALPVKCPAPDRWESPAP